MGNNVVKDFNNVKLGQGTLPAEEMITAGSMVLTRPATILVKWDDHRKSTIYFDHSTMLPLFVTTTESRRNGSFTSVTKDDKGRTLFITVSSSPSKHLIYRAPEEDRTASIDSTADIDSNSAHSATSYVSLKDFLDSGYDDPPKSRSRSDSNSGLTPRNRPKLESNSQTKSSKRDLKSSKLNSSSDHSLNRSDHSLNRSDHSLNRSFRSDASNGSCSSFALDLDLNSSNHSSTSNPLGRSQSGHEVHCAARIKIMMSGGVLTAALGVYVPGSKGKKFVVCYKASRIPSVKFGVLITDMTGEAVGKSRLDEGRMSPVIKVSPGADLPCVLAIASAVLRDV